MRPIRASAFAAVVAAGAWPVVAMSGCGSAFSAASATDGGASTDAEIPGDGGASNDAASDGGEGGVSASWCSTRDVRFCADFDETNEISALLGSWSSYEQAGGTFSLDTGMDVPSPPNALMVAATGNAQTLVIQTMPAISTRPTSARLEFDLRIDDAGPVANLSAAVFAAIIEGTTTQGGVVSIAIGNGPQLAAVWQSASDAGMTAGNGFGSAPSTAPFPTLGVWSGRFAIEIQYGGTEAAKTACAQIYQGSIALLGSCTPLPDSFADPHELSIALGQYSAGFDNTSTIQVRFDDVTFNY